MELVTRVLRDVSHAACQPDARGPGPARPRARRGEKKEQAEKQPQVIEKTRTLVVQTEKPVPRYLRPLGITSSLLGLGLIAGGATFLGLNGQCASPAVAPAVACDQLYSTGTPGIALTAAGAGVFLLGW